MNASRFEPRTLTKVETRIVLIRMLRVGLSIQDLESGAAKVIEQVGHAPNVYLCNINGERVAAHYGEVVDAMKADPRFAPNAGGPARSRGRLAESETE